MFHFDPLFILLLVAGVFIAIVTHRYTRRTDPTVTANQGPPPPSPEPLSPEEYARQVVVFDALIMVGGRSTLYNLAYACEASVAETFLSLQRMKAYGYILVVDRNRETLATADKARLLVHILPKGREWTSNRRSSKDTNTLQPEA